MRRQTPHIRKQQNYRILLRSLIQFFTIKNSSTACTTSEKTNNEVKSPPGAKAFILTYHVKYLL